jgi:hypothetical protein
MAKKNYITDYQFMQIIADIYVVFNENLHDYENAFQHLVVNSKILYSIDHIFDDRYWFCGNNPRFPRIIKWFSDSCINGVMHNRSNEYIKMIPVMNVKNLHLDEERICKSDVLRFLGELDEYITYMEVGNHELINKIISGIKNVNITCLL